MSIILNWNRKAWWSLFIFFIPLESAFGQEYCIDQSRYMGWLCTNVPGAHQACHAPQKVGKFPTKLDCDKARFRALPNDFRWQQMTECVPCGPPVKSSNATAQEIKGKEKMQDEMEKIKRDSMEVEASRSRHLKALEEEKREKDQAWREKIEESSRKIKISSPPMTSVEKERYRKALEQAYCMAHVSIQAARETLKGNLEVSKNLISNLELVKASRGSGFDDRFGSLCPKEINLKIPEARVSIEKDPQYKLFREVTVTVMESLIPKIEMSYKKIRGMEEKKKEIEQRMLRIEEDLRMVGDENKRKQLLRDEEGLKKEMSELLEEVKDQEKHAEELRKEIDSIELKLKVN